MLPFLCGEPAVGFSIWFSESDPLDWRLGISDYIKTAKNFVGKVKDLAEAVTTLSSSLSSSTFSTKDILKKVTDKIKDSVSSFKDNLSEINPSDKDWKDLAVSIQEAADKIASAIPDGGWGSKTPHIGYVHDISSTIAYHLIAVRALDLAFPLKPRWGVDKFQMIRPRLTGCYVIGSDRIATETGKMLGGDTPVWIYWYRYDCCVF